MQINGRRSCTGNSRHVHIRYFFVKDLIDKKNIRVSYCPTGVMLADFFTKPLQGELFRFFRSIVMGHTKILDVITVNEEMKKRVKKWDKYGDKLISDLTNHSKRKEVRMNVHDNFNIASKDTSKDVRTSCVLTQHKDMCNNKDMNADDAHNSINKIVRTNPMYADITARSINKRAKAH